jgi:hypothetical protein
MHWFYIESNDLIITNGKFEGIGKETVVAYFEALSEHFPEGTEENHERSQSG